VKPDDASRDLMSNCLMSQFPTELLSLENSYLTKQQILPAQLRKLKVMYKAQKHKTSDINNYLTKMECQWFQISFYGNFVAVTSF
jgi:hypothetical protein